MNEDYLPVLRARDPGEARFVERYGHSSMCNCVRKFKGRWLANSLRRCDCFMGSGGRTGAPPPPSLPPADPREARDEAVFQLLFLAAIEGMSTLSRGGKGCVFRAVEALRPDIAEEWRELEDPHDLLKKHFPERLSA